MTRSEKLYEDKDWLYKMYWEEGKSTIEMARIAKCNHSTISRWMRKCGVPLRTRSPDEVYKDRNWLHEMYWIHGKSTKEMAKIASCDASMIFRWMRKHGIPLRARVEAIHRVLETPEWHRKLVEGITRVTQGSEWRSKQAEGARRIAQDPGHRKRKAEAMHRLALKRRNQGEMTKIEAICHTAFESLDLKFIFEKPIYPYRADFFFPSHGIVVEAMGDYWHKHPERRKTDAQRRQYLECAGFIVLEWFGSDIKTDIYKLIDEQLLPLLDQPSRMERPPRGVSKPYKGPHGWKSATQLYLFSKEHDDNSF